MDPVRILEIITEYLNDHDVDGERMVNPTHPEEIEGDDDSAEVRINWGGRDLFDLSIKRI